MKKSILGSIPKPLLERAQRLIQNALDEKSIDEQAAGVARPVSSNTEVVYQNTLSLSEVINWGKDNYPQGIQASLAVIKDKANKKNYSIKISLAFVNNKQEVLSKDVKSAVIYCSELDESLKETFGTDEIIILE